MTTFYLAQETASGGGVGFFGGILYLAIMIGVLVGLGKTFIKAGKPGWACVVPFYNMFVVTEIAGKPPLWFFLLFIPLVNIYAMVIIMIEVAKAFGKGTGFGLGLIFLSPIFWCILGYGDATYQAPAGAVTPPPTPEA